jgi:transposase-like protein
VVTIKALDEIRPEDLWREVKPAKDEVWHDVQEKQRVLVKTLLEGALEAEMTVLLEAGRYRRTETRRGRRNGFYERDLVTQYGIVTAIRVPRVRQGEVERSVFSAYQRRQAQVDLLIRDVFLAGVSTRRVGETLESLLGTPVSAQTVSRVARSLDREVQRFHEAPLTDDLQYLFLDGVSMRLKVAGGVKRRMVLCAYGISLAGERRLLDFRLHESESQASWEAFLSQLRERGLLGKHLRLIATDGGSGLHAALQTVYPYVPRQRCWAHKLRNVANLLKRSQQEECLEGARAIYQAENRQAAINAYWAWGRRWRKEAPKAVECLRKDLQELLSFFACPEAHRRKVRTTNVIERCFREVRRRTRPMTCFNDDKSCERIIYSVASHLNRKWKGRSLLESTH